MITHNHPEGIKGAEAVALAVFLARKNKKKTQILEEVVGQTGYDLQFSLDEIREGYDFDATCQGSVPQALAAFREGLDFEDCIRNAVSLGGDSDTIACMTGSIAEAYYDGVPDSVKSNVLCRLDDRLLSVVEEFMDRFCR